MEGRGTSVPLSRVLHTFRELVLPRNPAACDSSHFYKNGETRKLYVCVCVCVCVCETETEREKKREWRGKESHYFASNGQSCFESEEWVRISLFLRVFSWISLTPCHPAENPPARPFAQPGRTPDPDRCHCGRAAAYSHQAIRNNKKSY